MVAPGAAACHAVRTRLLTNNLVRHVAAHEVATWQKAAPKMSTETFNGVKRVTEYANGVRNLTEYANDVRSLTEYANDVRSLTEYANGVNGDERSNGRSTATPPPLTGDLKQSPRKRQINRRPNLF